MARGKDRSPREVDPNGLDLGYLAQFVGMAFSNEVMQRLGGRGFGALRFSHGFVFQHVLNGPLTIGELAQRMEVTQQAASKACAELEALGFFERVADPEDARVRRVQLSDRGWAAVNETRKIRAALEHRLEQKHGQAKMARAKAALAEVLETLGGVAAVRGRRVRPPS